MVIKEPKTVYVYQIRSVISGYTETIVSGSILTRAQIADRVSPVFHPPVMDEQCGVVIPQDDGEISVSGVSTSGLHNVALVVLKAKYHED